MNDTWLSIILDGYQNDRQKIYNRNPNQYGKDDDGNGNRYGDNKVSAIMNFEGDSMEVL